MSYAGSDRRRHRVFKTRNTEYHFRDDLCVGVRDRQSSRWLKGHLALQKLVRGGVSLHNNGAVVPTFGPPQAGDAIYFDLEEREGEVRQIVTSRVEAIERPPKKDVVQYAL